jgi:ERF superfamily protein
MPDVPGRLAEALAALQGRLPRVAKEHTAKVETKTGGNYKYAYADLTDVSAAILPILGSLGLSFTSCPTIMEGGRFALSYRLIHVSGEDIGGQYPLPDPDRLGPQDLGKAITYARRYALCAVTGLAPGGDDDDAGAAQQEHQQLPRTGTNAELRAGGRMDRKQKADHEHLAADTVRGGQVERSHPRGPDPDDPWAQDAPVDHQRAAALRGGLDDRPEVTRGSTFDQQQQIAVRLAAKGITSREDKLVFCGTVIDRDIASSKELSYLEATLVLKAADELEAVNA